MTTFFLALLLAMVPNQTAPTSVNPFAGPHTDKTYSFTVTAGAKITVATTNGRVSVKSGPAGTITVVANRRAGTQAALAALGENVTQKGNDVAAAGTFPANCDATCGSVDFIVTVPSDTNVVASTTNGEIGVTDIDGTVVAGSVHGPVLCGGLAGDVTLGTKDGMVNAGFRDLSHVSKITLGTGNGVVRLVLPHDGQIGMLKAGTGNGRIFAPWPLKPVKKSDGSIEADQQISQTGPSVIMGTGKGNVNIVMLPQ